MKTTGHILSPLIFALLSTPTLTASEDSTITTSKNWVILPYAFTSDSTGPTGGIGMIKQGLFQAQTTMVASVFRGLEEDIVRNNQKNVASFYGGFFSFSDYELPFTNRLFFSLISLKSHFPKQQYYFDGSNDSANKKVLTTSGEMNLFDTTFKYVLPLGEGSKNPKRVYKLIDGFAQEKETSGNEVPFATGQTTIGIKTFYQENSFENWLASDLWKNEMLTSPPIWNTNGLRFFLHHDNTDFDLNPSKGYHFEIQYSKDYGQGDSLQSWDFLEFKFNKYYAFDAFSFTKQNVLALSLWTGYSFSWDNDNEIAPSIAKHRPPTWEGARLGGHSKMRGYNTDRFSDKAVFYAAAEYRAVLKYNPFKTNSLAPVTVDWFQVVAFAEAGRVNDKYNFDLLTDLKYDIGISLRAMVAQLPIRFDVAYGDEGANMWVMIQHPF